MKRVILFIGLFIFMCPMSVLGKEVEISTKKGLYVRDNTTTSSSIVGGLSYKSKVEVLDTKYDGIGCSDGWYKISSGTYSNKYICSKYVTDIASIVAEPEFSERVVTVRTELNLRKEPNKNSEKLVTLAKGKNYVATEQIISENTGCKNNIWYKIQVNQHSGYVCSAYLNNGASSDKFVQSCSDQISQDKANSLGVKTNETFVEINLTEQKLTLYKNGVCNLITSTVTGKEDKEKEAIDTATGSFRVIEKTRNKYFKSSNVYSNYWMRFYLGMGLHDADNWRSQYGYRDSHGCVNLPLSATKTIFDTIDLGTKVIVHK